MRCFPMLLAHYSEPFLKITVTIIILNKVDAWSRHASVLEYFVAIPLEILTVS